MPLPRSLAHPKREISEEKWAEARQWAGGRTPREKYKMPDKQKPDGTVADSSGRLASGFYQLKTGHCLTEQYLNWTKSWPTAQCWWCPCKTQTRDHLFKVCPEWKAHTISYGRRCGRKLGGGRVGGGSETSWPMGGAVRRYWTPSLLQMWEC